MKKLILKDLVKSVNEDNCPISYEAIEETLKYLDRMGSPEFDELKMKYIKGKLTRKESELMHWIMGRDEKCREDIKIKSKIYSGFKARKEYVQILFEQASAYQKECKFPEAIKCLQEVLELRPEDEEIKHKIAKIEKEIQKKDIVETRTAKPLTISVSGFLREALDNLYYSLMGILGDENVNLIETKGFDGSDEITIILYFGEDNASQLAKLINNWIQDNYPKNVKIGDIEVKKYSEKDLEKLIKQIKKMKFK